MANKIENALIALSMLEITNKKKHNILNYVDKIEKLADDLEFAKNIFNKFQAEKHFNNYRKYIENIDKIKLRLDKHQVKVITYLSEGYPEKLLDIDEFPILLYAKGNLELLNKKAISIVGTRRPTRYGQKIAEDFARAFARKNLVVVSGFARGVDTISHKTALEENGPTIAVMGSGLNICYPAENRMLYDQMLEDGNLMISEYCLDVKPLAYHFPERNRIISGLADGIFLPEATEKSGSLITIGFGLEQGKEIFIVPANINSPASEGSNRLLKQMQGALVLEPNDIFEQLGIFENKQKAEQTLELDFLEQEIVDFLYEGERHFEEILEKTKCQSGELNATLTNLEICGVIDRISGNYFALSH